MTTKKTADPVTVTNANRRDDSDAIEGTFVDVVSGEFKGRRGTYERTAQHDPKSGYPSLIIVRTRDARAEFLTVNYADVRPAREYFGGR